MTKITEVLTVPIGGAGYSEDLAALHASHVPLPQRFSAPPLTPGFDAVRQPAEGVSVGLVLDTGQVAWGDCVSVSYSGLAGREPVFRAERGEATVKKVLAPALVGRSLAGFRHMASEMDGLTETVVEIRHTPKPEAEVENQSRRALFTAAARAMQSGPSDAIEEQVTVERRLHSAVRYGASQALLAVAALDRGVTMAEVIAEEWGLPRPAGPVPIHAQSGAERYYNAEKMIVLGIDSLPHGLMENLQDQVGADGSELTRYIGWLSGRIAELGGKGYDPVIHLDLYGALGQLHGEQMGRILGQLYAWEVAAQPYRLRVESPVLMTNREAQIGAMKTLRSYVGMRKMKVQLVADEWANSLDDIRAFAEAGAADMIQIKMPDLGSLHNSVDAVLACRAAGIGAFLGGSYAETGLSARISVHLAVAARPDLLMAKPGMGVDEAISLTRNEMVRVLAQIRRTQ